MWERGTHFLHIDACCTLEHLRHSQNCALIETSDAALTWTTALFPDTRISKCDHVKVLYCLTSSFQDLSRALGAIGQCEGHNLVVPGEFDLSSICKLLQYILHDFEAAYTLKDDQWAVYTTDGVVPQPRRHLHHSGIEVSHDGGKDGRLGWGSCRFVGMRDATAVVACNVVVGFELRREVGACKLPAPSSVNAGPLPRFT
jgi:hypothetical protein